MNGVWSAIRRWKPSIGVKLIGGFAIVVVPIVVVGLISVTVATTVTAREIRQSYRRALNTLTEELGSNLQRLENMVDALAGYEFIHVVNQSPVGPGTILQFAQLLERLNFYSLIHKTENVLDVYLLAQERRFSSVDRVTAFPSSEHESLLSDLATHQGRWVFRNVPAPPFGRNLVYSRLAHTQPGQTGVVVTVGVHERVLTGILESLTVDHGGFVFLVDPEGGIVLPRSVLREEVEDFVSARFAAVDSTQDFGIRVGGESYRVLFAEPRRTGLIVGVFLPERRFTEPIRALRLWMIVTAAVALLLGSCFTVYERRNILQPIRELIGAMDRVQGGSFAHSVPTNRNDEIGVLGVQFNAMVARIAALVDEVNVEHLKHQQAQLRLLQSQINPHFLYNCLNVIYRLSVAGDQNAASSLALHLGKYYRTVTRTDNELITIAAEVDNAATYMEIHRIRHPNRLSYTTEATPDARSVTIPRLIIQPIVENAIIHGLDNLNLRGSVDVSARRERSRVIIEIADSGRGLDPDRIDALNAAIRDPSADRAAVGLPNCYWRLRLRYHDAADLRLIPRQGAGLVVRITVPADQEVRDA